MKKGFKRPPFSKEWIEKIRKASIGRIHTEAWKKEMSKKNRGEKSPLWKGNKISNYNALHFWVRKEFGKPKECETCKTKEAKIYDWANISGE